MDMREEFEEMGHHFGFETVRPTVERRSYTSFCKLWRKLRSDWVPTYNEWAQQVASGRTIVVPQKSAAEMEAMLAGVEEGWNMLHFSCDNSDHSEGYRIIANALGYGGK